LCVFVRLRGAHGVQGLPGRGATCKAERIMRTLRALCALLGAGVVAAAVSGGPLGIITNCTSNVERQLTPGSSSRPIQDIPFSLCGDDTLGVQALRTSEYPSES
jgi:hypothetical protein